MKKLAVLVGVLGCSVFAVMMRNETDMDYKIIGKKKTEMLRSMGKDIDISLTGGDSFVAEAGGKQLKFKLKTDENEIGSITLKKDRSAKLFADVLGKAGADDYEVYPNYLLK